MSILTSREFARRMPAAREAVRRRDLDAILFFSTQRTEDSGDRVNLPAVIDEKSSRNNQNRR